MANKKITDAATATSVAGTDKVFLNQGGDLKQVDLNSAVANSQAVQTLNSNLTNKLVGINVQSWAKTLRDGFYVYRTDNTCTGQYEDKKYTMGFVIYFNDNIRIFMFDMASNSNCFTCSKVHGASNWSNYIKIS